MEWICAKCDMPLNADKIEIGYLGSRFTVTVSQCPSCGMALITEEMALKKMAEAEQMLEDK